jgi:hypothetical protein
MDSNKQFYITLVMTYNNGASTKTITRVYSKTAHSNLDVFRLAFNVRSDMGCSLDANYPCSIGILVSSIISLLILFGISKLTGGFGGIGSLVIVGVCVGLFSYIGWFYWPLYLLLLIGALFAAASGFMRKGDN